MKAAVVSADVLFEQHRESLHWQWIAGQSASERRFDEVAVTLARSGADLVGYLNYIHPYRVQIVGRRETAYFANATPEDQERRIQRIVTLEPPVVVVADGESARVFRNVGADGALSLQQQELLTAKQLGDDSASGAAPTEQSPHEADEATFAKQLAHRLNHGALTNAYAHLVLVADPQTLGQMRPQLHKEVQSRLVRDLAKDFTNAPLEDIQRALG